MNEAIEWIKKGNTGCVFATLFAKNPESVGWKIINHSEFPCNDAMLVSIMFPENWSKEMVRSWALQNGFFEEIISSGLVGLRIKCLHGISWVQYFGKDSHVKTRQSPLPMLMYTQKMNKSYYIKVGFNGILHLAHAFSEKIGQSVYDLLWKQSFRQTKKILGFSPTKREAAKTTWERF